MLGWLEDGFREAHDAAMERLVSMRIVISLDNDAQSISRAAVLRRRKRRRNAPGMVVLNPHFRRGMQQSLSTSLAVPWKGKTRLKPDPKPPSKAEIDE